MKTSMKWKSRKNSIRVVIESPSHQISKKHENPMKEEKEKKKKKINRSTTNQSKEKWKKEEEEEEVSNVLLMTSYFSKKKNKKKKRHVCHCAFATSELLSKPRIAPRITGEKIKREREREREREAHALSNWPVPILRDWSKSSIPRRTTGPAAVSDTTPRESREVSKRSPWRGGFEPWRSYSSPPGRAGTIPRVVRDGPVYVCTPCAFVRASCTRAYIQGLLPDWLSELPISPDRSHTSWNHGSFFNNARRASRSGWVDGGGTPNTRTQLPKRPRVGVTMTSTRGWRGLRTSRVLDFFPFPICPVILHFSIFFFSFCKSRLM